MQWAGMICQVRRSVLVVRHIDPEPLPERPQDGLSFGARESPMRRHEQAMAAVRAALQQEHTTSTSPLLPTLKLTAYDKGPAPVERGLCRRGSL